MPTRGVCHQRTVGPLAGTYPTSQAASRWASRWNPLSVELCLRPLFGLAWDCAVARQKSITSHVYHEGVAQRAHNLSPVPFGAAKSDERSSYHCSDTASQSQRCSALAWRTWRQPPRQPPLST